MQVEIREGNILEADTEVIVCPSNTQGSMQAGLAAVIAGAAGPEVEREVMAKAPIAIGQAVVTGPGQLRFKAIIHVATVDDPGTPATLKQIRTATRAALKQAVEAGFKTVALPGLGAGMGKAEVEQAAAEMFTVLAEFDGSDLERALLIDLNSEMVAAWTANLDRP